MFFLLQYLPLLWLVYFCVRGIYRLTLHPLASFPGPRLAAFTWFYQHYYEMIAGGGGRYSDEIKRMHDCYGPVIRINPG